MQDIMSKLKALSDESRVRILCALEGRELCVCQLIELLGLAPSTVSKHLSILRGARLVESRKEGRWAHYRLAEAPRHSMAKKMIDLILESLHETWQIKEDRKRLGKILKMDTSELCRRMLKRC